MLDESPWGIPGVQVWAMYHLVSRTKLGEVSTRAQLRAICAQGEMGSLKASLVFYPQFSTAQVCQQGTTVLKCQA